MGDIPGELGQPHGSADRSGVISITIYAAYGMNKQSAPPVGRLPLFGR